MNTYFHVEIDTDSTADGSLYIYGDGTLRGISTVNFTGWATTLEAGNESSTAGGHTFGSVSQMKWKDTQFNLHDDWYTGNSTATLTMNSSAYASWSPYLSSIQSGEGSTC